MYISNQIPPVLTLAAPAELSVNREMESSPLKLQPYQIVRATVVEGGLDKVMLSVRQHQFAAETKVPLRSGQKLHLQVLSTHPQVHLRIMEAAELKHLFRTLHSLGQDFDLAGLLRQMQSVRAGGVSGHPDEMQAVLGGLIRLLQSRPGDIGGNDLARLWSGLGLDLESLLGRGQGTEARLGLKAALLMLADELRNTGRIPEQIERVLDQFTLFQLCRHRLGKEDVVFLPLPFPFLEQGYLLAEQDARQNDDAEGAPNPVWRISLHLKMTGLGNLEIKLLFEAPNLRLRILCESNETAGILSGALPGLHEALSSVSLRGFSVGTGAEDPPRALIRRLAPDGDHFLEVEA